MSEWFVFVLLMMALLGGVVVFYVVIGDAKASPPPATLGWRDRLRVLVLSAGVGGGHNAAARAVVAGLRSTGHDAVAVDGLRQMSPTIDWFLQRSYAVLLSYAPWLYDIVFRLFAMPGVRGLIRVASGLIYGGRLLRIVRRERPDLIVSTYPVVTAALGYLRRHGRLSIPVAAIVSDYGVHPMWVAPGIDQHLVVSWTSVPMASKMGGGVRVIRPLVRPEFQAAPDRARARAELGLAPNQFYALIVGGAWGIGNLAKATEQAIAAGVHAIVVAGHNDRLRAALEARFDGDDRVRIYGWTDEMPRLMAAADCLIQNAGGVTCLEAVEIGLPILIYEAIPGHGQLNARAMVQANAAVWVKGARELQRTLRAAATGETPLPTPRREPALPVATAVLATLQGVHAPRRRRWVPALRLAVGITMTVAALLVISSTSWGVALAARGLRVDMPGYNPPPGMVSLGVRATDPATARALEVMIDHERLPVAIFVNASGATGLYAAPGVYFGVAEDPHERVITDPLRIRQQVHLAAVAVRNATNDDPEYFLPASSDVNLTALAVTPRHARFVVPERLKGSGVRPGVLVLDTAGLSPTDAQALLRQELDAIHQKGLQCVPLDQLSP